MSRTATLDDDLLADALVGVVDDIRRDVHGALGTRPWSVAIVTRRWSGEQRGEGTARDTVLELDPAPMVRRVTKDRMGPAGRESEGQVTMTQVSLAYGMEELQPRVDDRSEVAYRLTEAHGQRQAVRWFVLAAEPVPRRGDKDGDETDWYILLNETSALGPTAGVDA
jgi:hypothetical protein